MLLHFRKFFISHKVDTYSPVFKPLISGKTIIFLKKKKSQRLGENICKLHIQQREYVKYLKTEQ